MNDKQSPEQEVHDELTAYLDGELDADAVRKIEERLVRDVAYQRELQKLDRAWSMLDRLPRAVVDDHFTKSTMEMVALSAQREAEAFLDAVPLRRRRQRVLGVLGMLAALGAGFGIGLWAWPDPNAPLLADLPVIENLDLYYQADDIEFLRLMIERGQFTEGDAASSAVPVARKQRVADQNLAQRRGYVAALEPSEQQDLLRRYERFIALPASEQTRLRELESAIDADPQADQLHDVLRRYHAWLKTLTSSQRANLAELSPRERVKSIERIQREQWAAPLVESLTRDDMRQITRWIDSIVKTHRDELLAGVSKDHRQSIEKQDDPTRQRWLIYRAFGDRGRRDWKFGEAEIGKLAGQLSPTAHAELDKATTLDDKRNVVRTWVFATLRRMDPWQGGRRMNQMVSEEMLQFLQNDVPPDKRAQLLKLPREEMAQQLRRLYFERGEGRFDGPGGTPRQGPFERNGPPGARDGKDRDGKDRKGPPPGDSR